MAMFGKNKVSPHSATVAADAVEQNIQVVENATAEKDRVAESAQDNKKNDVEDKKEKKKPTASIGNYFVSVGARKFKM